MIVASLGSIASGPSSLTVVLLLVALVALVVAVQQGCSPRARALRAERRLHRQIAAANGLDAEQSAFLWQLARAVVPDQPCVVFVRPSLLDGAAAKAAPELLRAIRRQLFDG